GPEAGSEQHARAEIELPATPARYALTQEVTSTNPFPRWSDARGRKTRRLHRPPRATQDPQPRSGRGSGPAWAAYRLRAGGRPRPARLRLAHAGTLRPRRV